MKAYRVWCVFPEERYSWPFKLAYQEKGRAEAEAELAQAQYEHYPIRHQREGAKHVVREEDCSLVVLGKDEQPTAVGQTSN